jgi:hypothetical protein
MNTSIRTTVLLFASALCLGAGPQPAWAGKPGGGGAYNYTLIRLAHPDATRTEAHRLNDRANVAGTYYVGDLPSGFHYDRASGVYTSLGPGTSAFGINQKDEIVGRDELLGHGLYWYWDPDTGKPIVVVLHPLGDDSSSDARDVNDAGIIVGESSDASGNSTPVVWYVGSNGNVVGPEPLPLLAGDLTGEAAGLTEEAGGDTLVVGTSGVLNQEQPVSWTVRVRVTSNGIDVTVTPADPFEGNHLSGSAWGVNNFGDAVGYADFPETSALMPFLRLAGQSLQPLPLLSKADAGIANQINDAGEIVGWQPTSRPTYTFHAVLWTNSTTVVDLSTQVKLAAGETLEWGEDINHRIPRGDILARIHQGSIPCLLIAK